VIFELLLARAKTAASISSGLLFNQGRRVGGRPERERSDPGNLRFRPADSSCAGSSFSSRSRAPFPFTEASERRFLFGWFLSVGFLVGGFSLQLSLRFSFQP